MLSKNSELVLQCLEAEANVFFLNIAILSSKVIKLLYCMIGAMRSFSVPISLQSFLKQITMPSDSMIDVCLSLVL